LFLNSRFRDFYFQDDENAMTLINKWFEAQTGFLKNFTIVGNELAFYIKKYKIWSFFALMLNKL
jgi:hypothetical protein